MKKILLVHGYGVMRDDQGKLSLGEFASVICNKVVQIHSAYDYILMLGGWHMSIGARPTIAEVMVEHMDGIKRSKIKTQFDLDLSRRMPARETMEEVEIAKEMLSNPVLNFVDGEIDVLVVWPFALRTLFLYNSRSMQVKILPVIIEVSQQCIADNMRRFSEAVQDPMGQSQIARKHFRERTLDVSLKNPIRS